MVKKFKIIRKKRKTIKMVNFPMPSTAKKFKIKKKIIPKSVGRGTPPVSSSWYDQMSSLYQREVAPKKTRPKIKMTYFG